MVSWARYGHVLNRAYAANARRHVSRLLPVERASVPIDIHPEVEEALGTAKPVVSLETALVTHGLPYPRNLELGLELEQIIRSTGSIPATIGMLDGRIKVGLERSELERLADPDRTKAKISRRDIAPAIASKADGGQSRGFKEVSNDSKCGLRYHLQCNTYFLRYDRHKGVSWLFSTSCPAYSQAL
jgi:hypothetical protein